jgi:hypothetical protein
LGAEEHLPTQPQAELCCSYKHNPRLEAVF